MESQVHLRLEHAIDGYAGDLTAMHDRMAATSAPIRKAAAR
jgi:hypothetical protein